MADVIRNGKWNSSVGKETGALSFVILAVVALAVRLLYFRAVSGTEIFGSLFLDSKYYAKLAALIRTGYGLGDQPYLLSPLYPYLLSLFTNAEGSLNVVAVQVLQAIAGSGTAVLVSLTANRIGGRRAGLLGGYAAALYGPLIYSDGLIVVASMQGFFVTLALWLLVSEQTSRAQPSAKEGEKARTGGLSASASILSWGGAGLALGLSTALRPTGLAISIAVVAFSWLAALYSRPYGGRLKFLLSRTAVFIIGLVIVIAPFTVANVARSGEFVLLSANGGFNFWIGNNRDSIGLFANPPELDFENDPLGLEIANKQSGRELSYGEASAWWRDRAIDDIRSNPRWWIKLMGKKIVYFFHPKEIIQLGYSYYWFKRRAWPLYLPLNGFHILVLSLFCPVMAWLKGGRALISRIKWPLVVAISYTAAMLPFFITGRYRVPIMPAFIILASVSAIALWDLAVLMIRQIDKSTVAVLAGIVAAFLIGHHLYNGPHAPFYIPDSMGAEEHHLGMIYYGRGEYEKAVAAYKESIAIKDNPRTRNNLASSLKGLGRIDEAIKQYEIILKAHPSHGGAWYNLGNLYRIELKDMENARKAYTKAADLLPLMPQAHLNLGLVSLELGDYEQAISSLERYLELAPPNDPNLPGHRKLLTDLKARMLDNP